MSPKSIGLNSRLSDQDDLQVRLIAAAKDIISEKGIQALTARALCERAGCSLGAIYTRFTDMDDVLFYVNALVFTDLGKDVSLKCPETLPARDRLVNIVDIYYNFANQQPNLWNAIFNHEITKDRTFPDWHKERMTWFFSFVEKIVKELDPDLHPDDVKRRTKTTLAAIHGITTMSSRNTFVNIPGFDTREDIDFIIEKLLLKR